LELPSGVVSCGRCGESVQRGTVPVVHGDAISPRSRLVMLLLCLLVGVPGVHRFYAGRIWTGFLWLFTLSLLGLGYLYDLIMILLGEFKDGEGRRIVRWE
jgi:hypothetical protein